MSQCYCDGKMICILIGAVAQTYEHGSASCHGVILDFADIAAVDWIILTHWHKFVFRDTYKKIPYSIDSWFVNECGVTG